MILGVGIQTNQKMCVPFPDVKGDTERKRTMKCEDGLALYERELNFLSQVNIKVSTKPILMILLQKREVTVN